MYPRESWGVKSPETYGPQAFSVRCALHGKVTPVEFSNGKLNQSYTAAQRLKSLHCIEFGCHRTEVDIVG